METPLSSTLSTLRAVGGRSSSELSPNTKKMQGLDFKLERAAPQSSHLDWFWGLVTQAIAGRSILIWAAVTLGSLCFHMCGCWYHLPALKKGT